MKKTAFHKNNYWDHYWLKEKIKILSASFFIVFLTFVIGQQATAFTGFPKGYDAYDHLSLLRIIRDHFPHLLWNPFWDGGVLLFYRNYPPAYHFFLGILGRLAGFDLPDLMKAMAFISLAGIAIIIFLIVRRLTGSWLSGIIAGILFLSASGVWAMVVTFGLYPRIFAMLLAAGFIFALINGMKSQRKNGVGLSILAAITFMSHFLASLMVLAGFAIFHYARWWSVRKLIIDGARVFLPAGLLVFFFYLPAIGYHWGRIGIVKQPAGGEYLPIDLLALFGREYPGLPFPAIPLAGFLSVLVWLAGSRLAKKGILGYFSGSGILAAVCLLYATGAFGHYIEGVDPRHFLLPAAFFLAIFIGLGLGALRGLGVFSGRLLAVMAMVLAALAALQASGLKREIYDQSAVWQKEDFPASSPAGLFRFTHDNPVMASAFNYFSDDFQTEGYWAPGVLFPYFKSRFQEEVFRKDSNILPTRFWLDWFAVREIFLGEKGLNFSKFQDESFTAKGGGRFRYNQSSLLVVATNAPVLLVDDKNKYGEILLELAEKGQDSRRFIPVFGKKEDAKNFSTSVMEMIGKGIKESGGAGDFTGSEVRLIHPGKWEITLRKPYTGVILKESYFPNWQAWLIDSSHNSRLLKIYLAGPGMMYAPLPVDSQMPAKIVFQFGWGKLEKIGAAGSLVGLAVLGWVGGLGNFLFKPDKLTKKRKK